MTLDSLDSHILRAPTQHDIYKQIKHQSLVGVSWDPQPCVAHRIKRKRNNTSLNTSWLVVSYSFKPAHAINKIDICSCLHVLHHNLPESFSHLIIPNISKYVGINFEKLKLPTGAFQETHRRFF